MFETFESSKEVSPPVIENTAEMHDISLPLIYVSGVAERWQMAGHQSAAAADVAVLPTCQRLHHLHPFATSFTKPSYIHNHPH